MAAHPDVFALVCAREAAAIQAGSLATVFLALAAALGAGRELTAGELVRISRENTGH